jgi:type II secretory ATPase GspE/PulE/Tfp pilus assembly ATPase PilB-like protein
MFPSCFSTAIMPSPFNQQPIASDSDIRDKDPNLCIDMEDDFVDLNQVYLLIDSILPFEACLYYQVLPLFIEGSRLIVGTVNPDDPSAAEYVKKQLSYINYSLSFRAIESDWHRDLLSKYLNHTAKKRQQTKAGPANQERASSQRSPASATDSYHLQQTFVVDQPEEITEDRHPAHIMGRNVEQTFELETAPNVEQASEEVEIGRDRHGAPLTDSLAYVGPQSNSLPNSTTETDPLHLSLERHYREIANDRLASLPPNALMQALLSRVLDEGIGRLYFERRSHTGRILWSRDGVLQAIVESIDAQILQGVINELKRLTHLSLISVTKSKQVEIERYYENQRILLRFRVIPTAHGEEATLQVLRGTALRFYQQQQIDRLGRDALDAAQVLQNRLSEIRSRARDSLNFQPTKSETLPSLIQLLKKMEAQVEELLLGYDLIEKGTAGSSTQSLLDDEAANI